MADLTISQQRMSLRTALTMDDGWRTGTTSLCSAAPRWRRPGSSSIVQVGILTFLCVFSDRKWCLVPPWWTMPWSFNALSTTEGSLCYICGAPIHSCSSSDIASCLQAASLKAGTCVSSVRCIHCRNVLNIRSIASWAWLPDDAGGSNLYHHLVVKLNVRTLLWWLDCSYWGQMFGGSISRFQDGDCKCLEFRVIGHVWSVSTTAFCIAGFPARRDFAVRRAATPSNSKQTLQKCA